MRDTFVRTLLEEAEINSKIELVTGDLGFGVLKPYWEALPDQFTNAGIAEQNMTTLAAGMALEGKIVFTYSIGNFPTLRCLEQIRNDCAYHNANVKIVCVGGGFVYGSLGMSHQATEDIAILRSLPNVTVVCPGDLVEAKEATKAIANMPGTCYLRLGRGGEKRIHKYIKDFEIGKAVLIRTNKHETSPKIAVFSTGAILDDATEACNELEKKGINLMQYSFHTVKPIDKDTIRKCTLECDYIVTIEEHNIIGGFGSAVSEVMSEVDGKAKIIRMGINDEYCIRVGDQKYLREQYGISKGAIMRRIGDL
ncbi:transketolase family protein [Eubacterium limosum]|uniref:Transketolase C-terminal domain-containing protein n=1 Tax=Eubacterium limosum TaxID=1736 RepID=A0ABT5UJU5_EUBLI|nr:transketolase C-terminal domain-containing protein [Eubacterium limosum]MCB6569657.1 transketolase [Eubacterium limosum]MDE1469171.1 transketolase C-terminal domain-containing protein [Eubacterium limosum]